MKTPGEILAAARRAREFSVEDVAERTKIPTEMIRAVEADEYHKLSGPLYVRSFLRTIAAVVGEDPERILDSYDGTASPASAAQTAGPAVWESEEVTVHKLGFNWQPWMFLVLAGLALLLVGTLILRGCAGEGEPQGLEQGVSGAVADSTSTDGAGPAAATVDSISSAPKPAEEEVGSLERATNAPGETTPCPGGGELTFSAGSGDLVLEVRMEQAVGIRVRADGQRDFRTSRWPVDGVNAVPPVPSGPVDPGRVYRCGGGLIVYWRADDHFGLILDRTTGVEAWLGGRPCNLGPLRPGQEIILDRHSVGL